MVLATAIGLAVPTVGMATAVAHAASDCTDVGTTSLTSLCVESSTNGSTTAPYATTITDGQRIPDFKWLLNEDDSTGDPSFTADNVAACLPARAAVDAATAASNPSLAIYQTAGTAPLSDCEWPSVHAVAGHTAVIASGDQSDIGKLAKLGALGRHKYLISITASGFKIDGVHFEVDDGSVYSVNDEVGAPFIVRMNPLPKKTATVRVHVYNDNASTNGQWDGQTETLVTCADATIQQVAANCGGSRDPNLVGDPSTDMSGFTVHINDVIAETTTDVFGNPLCTQYAIDGDGNTMLDDDGSPIPLSFGGGASGGALAGTQSTCISDHYGDIVIPNMGPNRYAATVIPPDPRTHNGVQWVQTTTLEGGHDWDTWNLEGGTGYDTELIVGGERVSPVAHGFVRLTQPDSVWARAEAAGKNSAAEQAYYRAAGGFSDQGNTTNKNGSITGTIAIGRAYIGSGAASPLAGTNLANARKDGVIEDGLISVSCIATCNAPTDSTVWTGRARTDGTFDINGLETGDYTVAFWDESQSYILAVLQYSVIGGQTLDVGDVLLSGWFTDLTGTVFNDLNGDGFHDENEPGIPDFVLTERTRGNSLQDQGAASAVTNDAGEYDLGQGYPLGQFLIAEAYNPRFKNTGFTYTTDNDPTPHTVSSAQVDIAFLPIIGLSATLDWGVQPYGTGTDYWSGEGVAPKNENGGIVGTVTYDVTRNEFDPAFSAQEDYQPGIAGLSMQLWKTSKSDGLNPDTYGDGALQQWGVSQSSGEPCERPQTTRGSNAVTDAGQDCKPYDYYVTESWQRPVGCQALDVTGAPLHGELALPDAPAVVLYDHNPDNAGLTAAQAADCVESPMNGFQIGGNGTVDGNYALTSLIKASTLSGAPTGGSALEALYADSQNNPDNSDPLVPGDYLVEVINPVDDINDATTTEPNVGGYIGADTQRRLYRFTDEQSINVFTGDTFVPQDGFVPIAGSGGGSPTLTTPTSNIRVDTNSLGAGTVAKCAGGLQTLLPNTESGVGSVNPDLFAGGGNPYAEQQVPVCDTKLVRVEGGRSVNPAFFLYTDVPIPSKFYGLINDDLNVNVDRRSTLLGEVAPAPNMPVGIYDENGNWKFTAHSDPNGFYEVLLPSMDTYNCPLPAGPCANVYRLVGNDPGTLAHRNADYNPQFRTISTNFQAWTGVIHPVDQAPTHSGITIEGPAAQFGALSLCAVAPNNPTLFAIDRPFYDPAEPTHSYTIQGKGFGATGVLRLGTATVSTTTWSDTQITFVVPANLAAGPYQLSIQNAVSGLSTVNGLTFHRLSPTGSGATYLRRNDVYEVTPSIVTDNPGARRYTPVHDPWDAATNTPAGFFGVDVNGAAVGNAANIGATSTNGRAIQRAVQAAYRDGNAGRTPKLVVIYPNTAANYAAHNANAAYFENVVVHGKVMLQGVGPGGSTSNTAIVHGTNIDASSFWSATQVVPPGGNQQTSDGSYSDDWRTFAASLNRAGAGPNDLPEGEGILAIAETQPQYGGGTAPTDLFRSGVDGVLLNGGDQQGNPGNVNTAPGTVGANTTPTPVGPAQGGAIVLDQFVRDFSITNNQIQSNGGSYGTIRIGSPDLPGDGDNHNNRLKVANNRIIANGGTNLAGALGLFAGATDYTVAGNDFCGNFSAEYGGAISHYGLSNNGTISKNRIYYNQGYDEGGGIMIAGALPANNSTLSPGAGAVTIDSNTLISNQSNDDGGGIRFLMAGNYPFVVSNNIIANNLSTHEGGGIALDDAPNVTIVNNTIVKNVTTGTAATNGALGDGIKPAGPAGISSGGNSALLQASLPAGSPNWSRPKLLNNIFADNRAGWATLATATNFNVNSIHGLGGPGDADAVQRWDVGVNSSTGLDNGAGGPFGFIGSGNTTNARTNAQLQHVRIGSESYLAADNIVATTDGAGATPANGGVGFVNPQDFLIDSLSWRVNTNVSFPVIVAHMVPINLLADYHLRKDASTVFARQVGVASASLGGTTVTAPTTDIDGESRGGVAGYDRGADQIVVTVDFGITKSAQPTTIQAGQSVTYTVVVTNNDTIVTTSAAVTDSLPAGVTGTWACSPVVSCSQASITGSLTAANARVTLAPGASATYTLTGRVARNTTPGTVTNTATVAPAVGSGVSDQVLGNNSASAVITVTAPPPPTKPSLAVPLDNFNRANANTLGGSWSQIVLLGAAGVRVNANRAVTTALIGGNAYYNVPTTGFGAQQAAAFTYTNATVNNSALLLKVSGGTPTLPNSFIRVMYNAGQITVATTTTGVLGPFTTVGTFTATLANGDTLTAQADADGLVDVWKTTAANVTTYIGLATTNVTGTGRIGITLPANASIDNFAGGTV